MIKFSVVIPLFNKQAHIARALDSVLSQTVSDFEVIVVDDGSTDQSAEVVRTFTDERIKLISQENGGVSAARNRGIVESTADFIAFLDADDAWKPGFLQSILGLILKFPQAGAYATSYLIRRPDGKLYIPRYLGIPEHPGELLLPSYFVACTLGDMPVWASAVCIPKSVFRDVGCFPIGEKLGEDHDMWARIALKYSIAFARTCGAVYFQNSENRACIYNVPRSDVVFIRNLQQKIDNDEVPDALMEEVRGFISMQLLHVASMNVKVGNRTVARTILADARTRCFPMNWLWWSFWSRVPYRVMAFAWDIKRLFRNGIGRSPEN